MIRKFLGAVVCIAIFVIYTVVGTALFGWKHGGGVVPMTILLSILALVWKLITNESNGKSEDNEKSENDKN